MVAQERRPTRWTVVAQRPGDALIVRPFATVLVGSLVVAGCGHALPATGAPGGRREETAQRSGEVCAEDADPGRDLI